MNILGYIIYLIITYYITVQTGYLFYKHGRIFIFEKTSHNDQLTNAINKTLLVCYYLLNLGYVAVTLYGWKPIVDVEQLISLLSRKVGFIIILLSAIHYINMFVIHRITQPKKSIINIKK